MSITDQPLYDPLLAFEVTGVTQDLLEIRCRDPRCPIHWTHLLTRGQSLRRLVLEAKSHTEAHHRRDEE